METLQPEEIEHLGNLLLSGDPTNIALGQTLLQPHQATVLPQMKQRATLFALLYPKETAFQTALVAHCGPFDPTKHPFYPFAKVWERVFYRPHNWSVLLKHLPHWERQSADWELDPARQPIYFQLYQILQQQYQSLEATYHPLLFFLLRKAVTFSSQLSTSNAYVACWDLVRLLHQHPPASTDEHYVAEVLQLDDQAHSIRPNPDPFYYKASFYETFFQDPIKAKQLYEAGLEKYPHYIPFVEALAELALAQDQYAESVDWLKSGIQQLETHDTPIADYQMGNLYWRWAQIALLYETTTEKSMALYQKALAVRPHLLPAVKELATLLWRQDQTAVEAIDDLFKMAVKYLPRTPTGYKAWGAFWEQQGRKEKALHIYEEAVEAYAHAFFFKRIEALKPQP